MMRTSPRRGWGPLCKLMKRWKHISRRIRVFAKEYAVSRLQLSSNLPLGLWNSCGCGLKKKGVFGIDLFDSEEAELVSIMAAAGFFMRTGERYQMTVPQRLNLVAIRDALVRLAETEDKDGFLHPERLLVTLTREEANSWKRRLMAMDWQQRLADREALLES